MLLTPRLRLNSVRTLPSAASGLPRALALAMLAGASLIAQGAQPTAAGLDWRPRAELPAGVRDSLPPFCAGGYVDPLSQGKSDEVMVPGAGGDPSGLPIEARALSARYKLDSTLYLKGDVELRQGSFLVTGSEARYDQTSGQLAVSGPLVSRGEGFVLTGAAADYDTDTGRMNLNTATFLLHGPEIRGSASKLSRVGERQVDIRSGRLTTCAPGRNDWALVASEIHLNRAEGFGTARHVRLEVKDVPVFYWPWASFSIDNRRKSGFLYPSFGSSSAGSGGYISLPYYLNLAPHYDATITPQYINGRGLFTEVEGRYLSPYGESVLQLGYISNDQAWQNENPGEDGERWGLDFSTQAGFGGGWSAWGDYSVVSDEDYLSDLNRTLDISQETHLERRGGIRYLDSHQFLEAYLSGYQTLPERIADSDKPYDQLPEILYGINQELGVTELSLESQYTYFHRDNENLSGLERANGQRLRMIPELALPLRRAWGYARPSVGVDYTRYQLEDYTAGDSGFDRTVPVAEWDSGLYFDRQSSLFDIPYNQTLEPRLYYAWADAEDQSEIPDFDTGVTSFSFDQLFTPSRFTGGDRVADANQLTVALTSRFNDLLSGAERARVSIGQVYYYDELEVSLAGQGARTGSESPLAGELFLRPLANLEIRSSGLWDHRTGKTEEGRTQLIYHSDDYRYLTSIGHTYNRDALEQMDIGTVFPVTNQVSLIGRWVYDSGLDRTVGSLTGVEYNNCCWSMQLVHQNYLTSDRELDTRLLFQIQLKGLGGSGGAGARISDAIYGFDERERRRFGNR